MPILSSEITWQRAALLSDTTPAQNGGRFTETAITSGIKNNLFPDVSAAQRAAGITHWRKLFVAVRNAANLPLVDPRISLEAVTPGDSYALLHVGTLTDTQNQVTGRPYGVGALTSGVTAGATSISVTAEDADYATMTAKPFQVGDLIRVDARATVLGSGDYDYAEIDTISYSGAAMTIGLTAGIGHNYSTGAKVAAVISPGDLQAAYASLSTTGGVTYDDTTYPVTVPALGGIHQTWTITVTDAATGAVSVAGDTVGAVGTGAMGVALAPVNANGGTYFTLAAAGWGGTADDGDTLIFTTTPAATPIWCQRVTPAGAGAISDDPVLICIDGESA